MRKKTKKLNIAALSALILLCAVSLFYNAVLPDNFLQAYNESFLLDGSSDLSVMSERRSGGDSRVHLGLFGILPVKTVSVSSVERPYLVPCGTPFGVKLLAEGVVVTGLERVNESSPAEKAGIKTGDIIKKINGEKITSSGMLSEVVQRSAGLVSVTLDRNGAEIRLDLVPERSEDGVYRLGVWTRDSCAGIGTMTFYDSESKIFGGLGHAICDVDTGREMPLGQGEIVPVGISSIVRGYSGRPGELIGSFMSDVSIGSICLNSSCGIFGSAYFLPSVGEALPMAFRQEIKTGAAKIMTTIEGTEPREYDIIIESIDYNSRSAGKNMTIRITDVGLLSETGGIVQGMSGSPIIQEGYIVGAVTHVFVNDSTRGYGIFAENMYLTGCAEEESGLSA